MNNPRVKHGCYFTDRRRRADYVIVVKERLLKRLSSYFSALENLGLQFELRRGLTEHDHFLLVHISQNALNHFSKVYDVGNEEVKECKKVRSDVLGWRRTELGEAKREEGFNSAERIVIIHNILEHTKYGSKIDEVGLSKLIRLKFVEDAYPLHDGPGTYDERKVYSLNDRQLLYRYWANCNVWYKRIPINAIQRYFGCEIAFYFAWVEFFNMMLLPASVIGLIVAVINGVILAVSSINEVKEVCNGHEIFICPTCEHLDFCQFKKLSEFCSAAKSTYVFDNHLTILFAIFMSFWATVFINLWRRQQNQLIWRWDVQHFDSEEKTKPRPEYAETLKLRGVQTTRVNPITKELELAEPKHIVYFHMAVTIFICILLILLVLVAVMGVILFKISINAAMSAGSLTYFKKRAKMISTILGSILQVIFIKLFGLIYGRLSIWLTKYENPRTQYEFDNSVLYKRYFLSFANNFAALFYLAFFKGRFFKLPPRDSIFRRFQQDSCQPTTCILTLCIQIFFLMLLKKFIGNILTFLKPHIKRCWNQLCQPPALQKPASTKQPQYEQEYLLLPTNRYSLTTEFCEMIIEYGFVTFFVAAFPLAPLCALLNNLLEQRLDAQKLVMRYRRPVARKVSGIGSWDGILLAMTYLSTATNALVIAFTSDLVGREVYRYRRDSSLKGYVSNYSLSVFQTEDYSSYENIPPKPNDCYFKGLLDKLEGTTPPKYYRTGDYWVEFTWRLIAVLIFEQLIFLCNGILSYAIPDIPRNIKVKMNQDRQRAREAKVKSLDNDVNDELSDEGSIGSFNDEERLVYGEREEEEENVEDLDEKDEAAEEEDEEEDEEEKEEGEAEDEDDDDEEEHEATESGELEVGEDERDDESDDEYLPIGPVIGPFRK